MSTTHSKPITLPVGLTLLVAGIGVIVFALAWFWGSNPEYADRFLILAGATYAAWLARPALRTLPLKPTRFGFLPLLLGAAAFPVAWFLHAQVGPKPVVLWWLTVAWVLAATGFVLTTAGWNHLRKLAFPLVFVLFALPVPNRILGPLQFVLQSATTSAAAAALPLLGVTVERSGFILQLPGGALGVAEACSGVRSVTALTAIAAFVGWWKGFGLARGVLLVGLSVPVIAGVNAIRVIVSGLLQEHAGPEYVRGDWHEGLGVAMVFLGLALIVGLATLIAPRSVLPPAQDSEPEPAPLRAPVGRGATPILICSALATVVAQFLGVGVEEELIAAAPLDQVPRAIGRWTASDAPIPPEVTAMLTYDTATHRVYRDFGYDVDVWMIFWSSRNMVKGYHHPDVCWPNRGFELTRRDVVTVPAGGGTVPLTVREFAQGSKRQLILYWTQEGRRVWSEEDEKRVQAAGDSHNWLGERLFRLDPPAATGRLVVLVGTEIWGDGETIRKQTLDLTTRLADEVYRVCPWAAPPGTD